MVFIDLTHKPTVIFCFYKLHYFKLMSLH